MVHGEGFKVNGEESNDGLWLMIKTYVKDRRNNTENYSKDE